jgi:hypothetical protein
MGCSTLLPEVKAITRITIDIVHTAEGERRLDVTTAALEPPRTIPSWRRPERWYGQW